MEVQKNGPFAKTKLQSEWQKLNIFTKFRRDLRSQSWTLVQRQGQDKFQTKCPISLVNANVLYIFNDLTNRLNLLSSAFGSW